MAYVFHCDGQYESSPYEVRRKLQNLLEPYGYYAKIELMTAAILPQGFHHGPFEANDHKQSTDAMEDFLAEALPQIEKCLPDWKALHGKSSVSAAAVAAK